MRPILRLIGSGRKGARMMATELSRRDFLRRSTGLAAGAAAAIALPATFSREAEAAAQLIDGVPHYDFRGLPIGDVQAAGALASDNAIAIVYYGNDPAVEAAARQAAAELRAQNWPVGIVLADGGNSIQTYVTRQPMTNMPLASADPRVIRNMVEDAFAAYQEYQAQLAANPPG